MKITTFIKRLEAIQAEFGNIQVSVYAGEAIVDRIETMRVLFDSGNLKPHCVGLVPSRLVRRTVGSKAK